MNPRIYPITNDNTPTLRLLVSATTSMRSHRWLIRVPFNTLEYDDRPGDLCRPFNVRGLSVDLPSGARLLHWNAYRSSNPDEIRQSVAAGIDLLLECDADAAAIVELPVVLTLDGAANDAVKLLPALTLPSVTVSTGTPWTIADRDGVAIGCHVVQLSSAGGARNYKGTWDASGNHPTLVSSTGTAGDTYVVSTAGTTTLDGISSWDVGDEVSYNGTVWQKIPVNTGVFRISNSLAEGDAEAMRANLGLKSFAVKDDDTVSINLESASGIVNLTTGQVAHSILRLTGKPTDDVKLQLPANQEGTWRVINEITGSATVQLANQGGDNGARSMALRPGVDRLYVANRSSGSVSILDSHTGAVISTLTGFTTPISVAFSTDGSVLYVGQGGGSVKACDPVSGTVSATYTVFTNPNEILVDDTNGCLWVGCAGADTTGNRASKVCKVALPGGTVTTIVLTDEHGDLDQTYAVSHLRPNADASQIFVWGSSGVGNTGGTRRCYVIKTSDNSLGHFDVGNTGGGGLAVDSTTLYLARGTNSLRYFTLADLADLTTVTPFGLAVGNGAANLLVSGGILYASNGSDNTITRYNTTGFVQLDTLTVPYAPGMLLPVTISGTDYLWVVYTQNNAVELINAGTGVRERFVALGAVEPLVLGDDVFVGSDGHELWHIEAATDAPTDSAPLDGLPLLDQQDYIERGLTSTAQTKWTAYKISGFAASDSTAVPYAKVIRTDGVAANHSGSGDTVQDRFVSGYIPVQRGAKVHFSVWIMRLSSASGHAGSFSLSIDVYDKNRRRASNGPVSIFTSTPAADDTWREITADYTLPLTHTVIDNSDGGPICYIRVRATVNTQDTGWTGDMQEIQWSRVLAAYADTARTQTLYANEASVNATVAIGAGSFTLAPNATASTVQAAIRALGGDQGAVVVRGGTTGTGPYSGSYEFTWPPGITPAPLSVTAPTDLTWTTAIQDDRSFTQLSDVPAAYAGAGGQLVAVKGDETGLEFIGAPGDVTGPGSSVDGRIPVFDGTSGKVLRSSGVTTVASRLFLWSNFS